MCRHYKLYAFVFVQRVKCVKSTLHINEVEFRLCLQLVWACGNGGKTLTHLSKKWILTWIGKCAWNSVIVLSLLSVHFSHWICSEVFNSGCPCAIIFIYDFCAFQTTILHKTESKCCYYAMLMQNGENINTHSAKVFEYDHNVWYSH